LKVDCARNLLVKRTNLGYINFEINFETDFQCERGHTEVSQRTFFGREFRSCSRF